jgi:lipopolysaccharide/colanic/teichoic acid biosynthesis glycosyltransferase
MEQIIMVKGDPRSSTETNPQGELLSSKQNRKRVVSVRPIDVQGMADKQRNRSSTSADMQAFENNKPGVAYLVLKRSIDVIVATLVLVAFAPLFVLIAIAIVLDNPGPVLFTQVRVGRNNKPFRFYKFRSMVKNASALQTALEAKNEAVGPIFKMRRDPRVTRVGRILRKYSLDELPQLFSVLRGQMSLVGPRPHLPAEVAQYEAHQRHRLTVQPGLVCLREIHGRSELTFERWIELDLQYIACRSLRTDLSILVRLVPAVVCGRGAY